MKHTCEELLLEAPHSPCCFFSKLSVIPGGTFIITFSPNQRASSAHTGGHLQAFGGVEEVRTHIGLEGEALDGFTIYILIFLDSFLREHVDFHLCNLLGK